MLSIIAVRVGKVAIRFGVGSATLISRFVADSALVAQIEVIIFRFCEYFG